MITLTNHTRGSRCSRMRIAASLLAAASVFGAANASAGLHRVRHYEPLGRPMLTPRASADPVVQFQTGRDGNVYVLQHGLTNSVWRYEYGGNKFTSVEHEFFGADVVSIAAGDMLYAITTEGVETKDLDADPSVPGDNFGVLGLFEDLLQEGIIKTVAAGVGQCHMYGVTSNRVFRITPNKADLSAKIETIYELELGDLSIIRTLAIFEEDLYFIESRTDGKDELHRILSTQLAGQFVERKDHAIAYLYRGRKALWSITDICFSRGVLLAVDGTVSIYEAPLDLLERKLKKHVPEDQSGARVKMTVGKHIRIKEKDLKDNIVKVGYNYVLQQLLLGDDNKVYVYGRAVGVGVGLRVLSRGVNGYIAFQDTNLPPLPFVTGSLATTQAINEVVLESWQPDASLSLRRKGGKSTDVLLLRKLRMETNSVAAPLKELRLKSVEVACIELAGVDIARLRVRRSDLSIVEIGAADTVDLTESSLIGAFWCSNITRRFRVRKGNLTDAAIYAFGPIAEVSVSGNPKKYTGRISNSIIRSGYFRSAETNAVPADLSDATIGTVRVGRSVKNFQCIAGYPSVEQGPFSPDLGNLDREAVAGSIGYFIGPSTRAGKYLSCSLLSVNGVNDKQKTLIYGQRGYWQVKETVQ